MDKMSISPDNSFCPQTLFLYGTYKEDGSPNFGLFCWFSYCFVDNELGVMACIGGEKLTKDRIKSGKVFSANLVTESLLPLADYLGNTDGYTPNKMDISIEVERGAVLPVPVLKNSPWVFELEVAQSIQMGDSEVFICRIRNTLVAKKLMDESVRTDDKMKLISPAITMGSPQYFAVNPDPIGKWGEWKEAFKN